MIARTGTALLLAGAAVALTLTGCTAPESWAARLNPDGTVDVLECDGPMWQVHVDYVLEDEVAGAPVEWRALVLPVDEGQQQAAPVDVVYYGEPPAGWHEDIPAAIPPEGWIAANTSGGFVRREELVHDTWVWFTGDEHLPWATEHPCDGWELGADGEPRRIP